MTSAEREMDATTASLAEVGVLSRPRRQCASAMRLREVERTVQQRERERESRDQRLAEMERASRT